MSFFAAAMPRHALFAAAATPLRALSIRRHAACHGYATPLLMPRLLMTIRLMMDAAAARPDAFAYAADAITLILHTPLH